MVKFRYSMQSILNLKYRLEDQAKGEYALAKHRYDEEIAKLEQLKNRRENYENYLRSLMLDRLDFQEIQFTKAGIVAMEDAIVRQNEVIKKAWKEVEAASEKLKEFMIERKTQEKLREKAFEVYLRESAQEEQKETDEIVSYRFNNQ